MGPGLVAVAAAAVASAAWLEGRRRCPRCGGWFARRSSGSAPLGARSRQETRYAIASPSGDHSYSHSLRVTHDDREFRCFYVRCGHRWSELDSRTPAPFSRSSPLA